MIFPPQIPVYGDQNYRGACPVEDAEHMTFINMVRKAYPTTWGRLILHPKNEGKRNNRQAARDKAMGSITKGASDFILPARVPFIAEMKRADHTQSIWQPGQKEYLIAAHDAGAFACIVLGHKGAWEAFEAWMTLAGQ